MIRAENLSKIYKSKKKNSIHALRDLNFVLPDSGFVFVVGKSGSGKSTLLNILGGLDSLSRGDAVVNGNCFSKFTNSDYDNYRNAIAGFIFQDFHLIDDITVAENIALALDLQSDEDYSKIDDALKMVDLPDVGSRFPEELSGGQKQRVAIARALVKDPKIVLADEPTGNLDNNTTRQILELLKGISKNRLVLMVSHNLNDAYSYADRIMELSDGELISDKICRVDYNDNIEITDGVMHLPYLKQISNEDEELIENALSNGNIKKIKQNRDKFVPLAKEEYKE